MIIGFVFQKMLLARASRWADKFSPPRDSTPPGPSTSDQAGFHPLPLKLAPSSPKLGVARSRPVIVTRLMDDTTKGAAVSVAPPGPSTQVCVFVA